LPGSDTLKQRGRVNALQRYRAPDDPELLQARGELKTARAEDYIRKLVDKWPPLTQAQRERLALLLHPGTGGGNG
jgi:hypothetical protein